MIRVTIDLVPFGNEDEKTTLHTIDIWNDISEGSKRTSPFGSYGYRIGRKGGGVAREGRVTHFPRLRKNAVHLLHKVLDDAYSKDR